ncbi:MAG: bis(5'-nucleosyl)-tetraphosphatase (symmetrical) YqeK [Clostridia bacterium]|nr:bis(5'-nucleosyl)-tetraphosphatase (symmetrical) YqeK [Clostridia bacterium]
MDVTKTEMKKRLHLSLSNGRYAHTLGVAATAKRLAFRCGVSEETAEIAGLLHDCAKSMPIEAMISITNEMGVFVDDIERQIPDILHAPAGCALARRDYGIEDSEILSAIRLHTIGGKNLSPLEMLIYLSDFIEPQRKPFDGLERVRALAEEDISLAAQLAARLSTQYVLSRGGLVHPATLEMFKNTEEIQ